MSNQSGFIFGRKPGNGSAQTGPKPGGKIGRNPGGFGRRFALPPGESRRRVFRVFNHRLSGKDNGVKLRGRLAVCARTRSYSKAPPNLRSGTEWPREGPFSSGRKSAAKFEKKQPERPPSGASPISVKSAAKFEKRDLTPLLPNLPKLGRKGCLVTKRADLTPVCFRIIDFLGCLAPIALAKHEEVLVGFAEFPANRKLLRDPH